MQPFRKIAYTFMLVNHRANMGMHNFYVAPMGVFSEGAMASKNLKKKLFLKVFSLVHIYKTVIWSLSSKEEYKDIVREIGQKNVRRYVIAEDLPGKVDYNPNRNNYHNKIPDKIDVVFLS